MAIMFFVQLAGLMIQGAFLSPVPGEPPHASVFYSLISLGCTFLLSIVGMAFAVGVHRTVLLDEVRSGAAVLQWDGGLWRYFGTILVLAFCFAPFFVVAVIFIVAATHAGSAGAGLAMFCGFIVGLFVSFTLFYRLILSLPAAAIGVPDRFELSWRATRGNLWRLFAAKFLVILPFIFLAMMFMIPHTMEVLAAARSGIPPAPSPFGPYGLVGGLMVSALGAP